MRRQGRPLRARYSHELHCLQADVVGACVQVLTRGFRDHVRGSVRDDGVDQPVRPTGVDVLLGEAVLEQVVRAVAESEVRAA
jgi:hypothetical protein